MTNKPNVTSKYEEERARTQEQSQIVYLQGQIDELRRQLKDQTNKYNWTMEQMRKVESSVAQIEGLYDRHRQEVSQALDGYRRDIGVLRKEIAGALVKVEEGHKPIREMQTQIHQLGEARKQDREQVAGWLVRIEEVEQRTLAWQARIKEGEERDRALATQIEGLYAADEGMRTEMRKINEDLQIEKQSLRRQAVEAQQLVADVRSILDDHQMRQLTAWLERVDGWLRELDQRQTRTISRFESTLREQQSMVNELDQRDIQFIDLLATALKDQLEQLKAAQVERGGASSGTAS